MELFEFDSATGGRLRYLGSPHFREVLPPLPPPVQQVEKKAPEKPREFIAFDWCGWDDRYGRFTHVPSSDTLTQQAWMGQLEWNEAQLKWFQKWSPALVVHKNMQSGPYQETGDTFGTVGQIIDRLKAKL